MGALVRVDLPGRPALELPWVITFGPLGDDAGWEPVVCGPYERPHALALAEAIVADEDLLAVVEPMLPYTALDDIRREIAEARLTAPDSTEDEFDEPDDEPEGPPTPDEVRAGQARIAARLTTP